MAASITFDFLSRGAGQLQSDVRKIGDNTALAARGAKVLSDAIEQLGKKEDRTAAESATLAKALRLTGDAEDRVAAKAVLADAAVRRLDDAMKDAAKKPLIPEVISAPALAKLAGIKARAEELKARFPEFTVRIDDTAAKLKLAALAAEAKATDDAISRGFGNAGGGGNRLGGLFSGGGGAGGPAAGGGGLLASPAGLGALGIGGALLAALTPGIVGLGIGGAVGGGAIAGGLFGAAEGKKTLNADLSTIKTLTIKLKTAIGQQKAEISAALKDAEKQYSKDAAFFAPFTAFQSSLQGLAKTLIAPLRTVMAPLTGIFTQFGKGLTALGPQVAGMFKASLPFVDMFMKLLLSAGKTLIPAFTGAMNTMVKSGALKSMSDALVIIVQGLAGFVTALGPGMASSATIFKGLAVIIAAVLRGLGLAFAFMANTFADNMHHIRLIIKDFPGWFDTARHEVAHIWDVMFQTLIGTQIRFGHNVEHAWDTLMSDLSKGFDIFKNVVGIAWDDIKLDFLSGVRFILSTMGKLPGPLGAPFRAAAKDIGNSMAGVEADVRRRTGQIQRDIDSIHGKTVHVFFVGSGSGSIAFKESIPGVTTGPSSSGLLGFHAAGGLIRAGTGPAADDVPAMLSRGELVVPANMVAAGAVDHLRGRLPGFASGGLAGGVPFMAGAEAAFGRRVEGAFASAVLAKFKKDVAQAAAAGVSTPIKGKFGAGVGQWAGLVRKVLAYEHLNPNYILDVLYQMQTESGGRVNAINLTDTNAQHGDPSRGLMQVIMATFRRWHWPGTSFNIYDPEANIAAALNYGAHNGRGFGTGPGQIGSGHGYALGGLVGYASGGTVGRQGAAYLKAWQTRHGGGYGAAWGPVQVNPQIDAANRALGRNATLAGASLPASQHKHYVAAAAWWRRHRDALVHERGVMRDWRGQLGGSDAAITGWIRAAGTNKALAPSVKRWKGQRAFQEKEIAAVSAMLGWSAAQQAAIARAHPPGKPGKPGTPAGPPLPAITHTTGAVTDVIEAFLQAHAAPFGAARGALVMDSGGTLRPGWNAAWNGTGRPEQLVPARGGGGDIHLHLTVNAPVGSQRQLEDWFVMTANKTAHHGRLSQAVKRASL